MKPTILPTDSERVYESSEWRVYTYKIEPCKREDGSEISGLVQADTLPIKTLDLSDDNLQDAMLRDWLNIRTVGDLMDRWLPHYGMPFDLQSFQFIDPIEVVQDANRLQALWSLYMKASENPAKLEEQLTIRVLLSGFVPGKPFIWTLTNNARFPVLFGQEADIETPGEREQRAAATFEALREGLDPFAKQINSIEKAKAQARKAYPDLAAKYPNSKEDRPATARIDIEHGLIKEAVAIEDLLHNRLFVIQSSIYQALIDEINGIVSNVTPKLVLVETNGELQFQQSWQVRTPETAIYLALFKRVTRSGLWALCPHPDCGKTFVKKPSNKESCGSETCSRWVRRQKSKQKGE